MTNDDLLAAIAEAKANSEQYLFDAVLREQGYIPGMVPSRPVDNTYGVGGAAVEAAKRGWQQFTEDVPGGITDIPAGIARSMPSDEPYQDLSAWERLKGIGGQAAGVVQTVSGPFRTLFAPLSGVTRAVSEFPYLVSEVPGEPRSPEREQARYAGQIAFDLASGFGIPKAISLVQGVMRARGVAPAIDMTRGRLLTGEVGVPDIPRALPAPDRGIPQPGATYTPPDIPYPPPEPPIGKTQALRDPATGRVIRGPQHEPLVDYVEDVRPPPPETYPPGRTPHEATAEITEAAGQMKPGETIGQTMRRLRQEKNPQLREDITVEGKPPDMSLRDWVKLNRQGEGAKLESAVAASADDRAAAPPHIQAAAESVSPSSPFVNFVSSYAPEAGRFLDKFAWYTRRFLSPEFITRNDPAAKATVDFFTTTERQREFLESDLLRKLIDIRNEFGGGNTKLGNAEIQRIFAMRDRGIVPTNPSDVQKLRRIGPLSDEAGRLIGITPDHPDFITNFVTRARNNVVLERTRMKLVDDYPIFDVKQSVPGKLDPYFTKRRTTPDIPGEKYDVEYLANWLRGVARASVYGTTQHHGALQDLPVFLNRMANSSPEMQEYVAKLANYTIGHPASRSSIEAVRTGNLIRNIEFSRTINPMSAAYNTLQRIPTFVEVGAKAWMQGLLDEIRFYRGNVELRDLVKRAKIDPEAFAKHKLGLDQLAETETAIERGAVTMRDIVAKFSGFGASESGNRIHGFFSGYRNALNRGLTETEAIDAGVKLMEKGQFALGRVGRPEAFRKEPGAVLGQYKSFPIKMAEYTYRNAEDVIKGLRVAYKTKDPTQLKEAAGKFIRLWGAQYALGGAAVIPFLGDQLAKIDPIQWKGLAPYLGMAIDEQLGLGVLDAKDYNSLMFWLPGPAWNHIQEMIKGGRGLAVHGLGVDPVGGALGAVGIPAGNPPSVSETARSLTRSVPLGGVVLERLRRGKIMEPGGGEREPRNLTQAFGLETIPSTQPLIRQDTSMFPRLKRSIGIFSPERAAESDKFTDIEQEKTIRNNAIRAAQQAKDSGDINEAYRIIREAENELAKRGGRLGTLKLTKQSAGSAQRAAESPVLRRMRQAAGKQLGSFRDDSDTIE